MKRIVLFEKALEHSKLALLRAPYMFPLQSVIDQLQYLLDLEAGKITDASCLKTITIGQIAARDIDDFDSELADLLHDVSSEVLKMNL
ncbi:MAG: hypothetical protein ING36_10765 [Burkholderiales bacterium]|nr:hypothetical protein [Burkholderiales bacterium]